MNIFDIKTLREWSPDSTDETDCSCSILSCLKESEQSGVYLVRLPGEKSSAILKTSDDISSLQAEYQLLCELRDSAAVHIPLPIAFWVQDSHGFLLRQYVRGFTLRQWFEEQDEVNPQRIRRLGLAVCDLLAVIHGLGCVVRDIKPDNFVLTPSGELYLIDMNTVRHYKPGQHNDTSFLGTVPFAAPEQYGFAQTDGRTDIYGVGMMLGYLCTGKAEREQILGARLPHSLSKVIRRCVALDPSRRYRNAEQLRRALKPKACLYALLPAAALLIVALGLCYLLRPVPPTTGFVLDNQSFSTLSEAINAIPKWTDGEVILYENATLSQPLFIESRNVTLSGGGIIRDAMSDKWTEGSGASMIYVTADASLTIRQGITLHSEFGESILSNNGSFTGFGNLSCYNDNGQAMLVYNCGQMRLEAGEWDMNSADGYSNSWALINDTAGQFEMTGGLIRCNNANVAVLNKGFANYNGGFLMLYPPQGDANLSSLNCLHDFEQGASSQNGISILVNDVKIK
ncbi:MAG: hypothetical protein PHI98_10080 [Eubacteriales bacterium]|nr:hypothetical protein [Eubacteriales bacterium]